MPVVAISVVPEFYNDYVTAPPCKPDPFYGAKFWEDDEFPAHVEYFPKGSLSKEKAFEIDNETDRDIVNIERYIWYRRNDPSFLELYGSIF